MNAKILGVAAIGFVLPSLVWAGPPKSSAAKVVHADAGGTITLTADAERRLGITLGAFEKKTVADTLERAAEIITRPGGRAPLIAPVTGRIVVPPGQKELLLPGTTVVAGQVVLRILPLIAPDRNLEVEAQRDHELARARLDMAEKRATRMKTLLDEGAVDVAALEQADTDRDVARAELAAAKKRMTRAGRNPLSADVSIAMRAPFDGVLLDSVVAVGQTVIAGAPLAEVVQMDQLWVRVPLYVGALETIDRTTPATVHALGSTKGHAARIVDRPPVVGPGSSMVIFYALDGATGLMPGARATIALPLFDRTTDRLVVPWRAIVRDHNGVGWVYVRSAPLQYTRRRVDVERVIGDDAVLLSGPAAGTEVATAGVMELFGTETGIGK